MPNFSANHRDTVCNFLRLDIQTFESLMRDAANSLDGCVDSRTIEKSIRGAERSHPRTRESLIRCLHHIGFSNATEAWLSTNGAAPPDPVPIASTIPEMVSPDVKVPEGKQHSIATAYGGCYKLYRRHGGEPETVQEMLYFSRSPAINHPVYYLNRRGAVYSGWAYRVDGVLYIYLFRKHDDYGFASRTLMLNGETRSSEPHQFASGVMMRVQKSFGLSSASDVTLVRSKPQNENWLQSRLLNAATSGQPFNLKLKSIKDRLDTLLPREFVERNNLSTDEKILVDALSDPVIALSQEKMKEHLAQGTG